MINKFRGWGTVFGFTFKQAVGAIGFKVGTAIVSFLIIAALIAVNLIVANVSKDKGVKVSPIETVYVQDNSGLAPTSYGDYFKASAPEAFGHIGFETASVGSRNDIIIKAAKSSNAIAVFIQVKEEGFEMEAVIPSESEIKTKQANALLKEMITAFETNKLIQSGISPDQLTMALNPVVTTLSDIGESTNEMVYVIKLIAPMLFGLVLYIMLILYGQIISKSVSTEKTSKLMETLLTSIHPYALISGKILGIAASAILQFAIWIAALTIGLFGGNTITQRIFPEYENSVVSIINFLKENISETAFSLPAVIIGIVFLFVGFLFYCVIAGFAGCLVSKPEEVASTQAIFQFPIIISFLICYMAPIYKKEGIITIARYVPFTSPFTVPVDLITGTIGIGQGIISLVVLCVFSLIVIMISARIYRGLVLYTGQKISLKMIGNVIKSNK
jgi:ABC-2 type transport system permease protein